MKENGSSEEDMKSKHARIFAWHFAAAWGLVATINLAMFMGPRDLSLGPLPALRPRQGNATTFVGTHYLFRAKDLWELF